MLAKTGQALQSAETGAAAAATRMAAVAAHSWEARFQEMEAVLERVCRPGRHDSDSKTLSVASAAARHE